MEADKPTVSLKTAALDLFCASLIVLFQELALIRWFPGQVRVLAYFPNLILISAFLGLGIGCLVSNRRSLLWLWPMSLLVLVGAAFGMSHVVFTQSSVTEHLWLLYQDMPEGATVVENIELPIITAFVLSAVTFVPLGQIVGSRLDVFREHSSSLWGYCWDLGGSLVGVIGFAVVNFLGLMPVVWFGLLCTIGLVFFRTPRRAAAYLAAVAAILGLVHTAERAEQYSAYYALSTEHGEHGLLVSTNGSFHQYAMPLERDRPDISPVAKAVSKCFHSPYRSLARPVERALVLGAGTGNDVAVLLDEGAGHVDAVEIDPIIIELGKAHHPSRPYDSDRVQIHNTDARSFLNDTEHTYDLIVFGTLDSQTRLSALSNVRLDNFVYTLESIRAARARLTQNGGMILLFYVAESFIHERIHGLVAKAFGEVPITVTGDSCYLFNHMYLAGPAFAHIKRTPKAEEERYFTELLPELEIPTDDWPFLYLQRRGVSSFYLVLMAVFAVLALLGVALASREIRAGLARLRRIDLEMLLFGAAFLLMETTFVTSMNLVWGATWLTSAVVFGSILATVLAATIVVQKWAVPWWLGMVGLLATLIVTYLVPTDVMLGRDVALKLVLSVLFVGAPVFLASICFALRFRVRKSANVAFGWNLVGAVLGGLLEFFSMLVGFKALMLVALCFYLGVALFRQRDVLPHTSGP